MRGGAELRVEGGLRVHGRVRLNTLLVRIREPPKADEVGGCHEPDSQYQQTRGDDLEWTQRAHQPGQVRNRLLPVLRTRMPLFFVARPYKRL
jgi:hypothetical protein